MKAKDIFQYALAGLIVVGWFIMFIGIFVYPIPEANTRLGDMMFGSLTTAVIMVLQFFYGSNKESAVKTEMLYKSTPPATNEP